MSAVTGFGVTFEYDAVTDAVDLLQTAHRNLAKRHGDQYRSLERRIEALAHDQAALMPIDHSLGDGLFVLTPSNTITAVIREARRLGVV